jgi:molybdate transport system substrate-binding protein
VSAPSLRSRLRRAAAVAALAALAGTGARAAELTVSAAASLTNAFRAIGAAFEARNPGTRVQFNFAASDALLAQIATGAPVDVYASADRETMDRAEAGRLLAPGTRRDFARNALVVVQPADAAVRLAGLGDLRGPDVKRIAIGAPAGVPAGRYARSALEAARLWSAVEPKAVFAQNVRQALDYVARGEVEAGFVYATDAAIQKDKVRVAFAVPTGTPIAYPVAVLAQAPDPEAARRFVAFVASPEAQATLAGFGFSRP